MANMNRREFCAATVGAASLTSTDWRSEAQQKALDKTIPYSRRNFWWTCYSRFSKRGIGFICPDDYLKKLEGEWLYHPLDLFFEPLIRPSLTGQSLEMMHRPIVVLELPDDMKELWKSCDYSNAIWVFSLASELYMMGSLYPDGEWGRNGWRIQESEPCLAARYWWMRYRTCAQAVKTLETLIKVRDANTIRVTGHRFPRQDEI